MAIATNSSDTSTSPPPQSGPTEQLTTHCDLKTFDETTTWIDFAVYKARLYQKAIQEAAESAFQESKSRFSQIQSTSSAHFQQTRGALKDIASDYVSYEDFLFAKVKEGVNVAASRPMTTFGVTAALGLLAMKEPRRFVYNNTLRFFVSEETLIARADAKVKALQQSIDLLKAESEKLEKGTSHAEAELWRGRTKLRQAGKQIQGVIRSAYKIEKEVGGLKDILEELPKTRAAHIRSQVSGLAKEAKRERNILSKQVAEISNHGISV